MTDDTATSLRELADRVEKLTGPDREVDALIYCAANAPPENAEKIWAVRANVFWRGGSVTQGPLYIDGVGLPTYTASLDAAMMLVPKLMDYEVGSAKLILNGYWTVLYVQYDEFIAKGCASPALALTAAALRGRAALSDIQKDSTDDR